jgi:hypothetical protein
MKSIVCLLIASTLTVASGCAKTDWIDRTLVTVDVTGTWSGSAGQGSNIFSLLLELQQEGSKVTGSMQMQGTGTRTGGVTPAQATGPVEGTVAGDVFTFNALNSPLEAQMIVSGDEMSGRASSTTQVGQLTLRRIDSPARPGSPPR